MFASYAGIEQSEQSASSKSSKHAKSSRHGEGEERRFVWLCGLDLQPS